MAELDGERIDAHWGGYLLVQGTTNDFQIHASIDHLREFFPADGSVALDLRIAGSAADGRLAVRGLAIDGERPFDLTVPIRTVDGRVVVERSTTLTPLGPLSLGGTFPNIFASLELRNWEPIQRRFPEASRAWIPTQPLLLTVSYHDGGPLLDARMAFYQAPSILGRATNLKMTARLEGKEVVLDRFEGELGGGPFKFEGRGSLETATLHLTGKNMLVYGSDAVRVRLSSDTMLQYEAGGRSLLSGTLQIPLALLYQDITTARGSAPTTRELQISGIRLEPAPLGGYRIPGIPGMEQVALNLRVTTTGELRIENSDLGAIVKADLWVQGTGAEPSISGWVASNKGEVRLASGMFLTIHSAQIQLPQPFGVPPTIDFEGRLGTGESAITVRVAGRLEKPQLYLTSERPRSQQELLAQLAFGRLPGAVSGGDVLSVVGTQVTRQLVSRYSDDWPKADRERGFFEQLNLSLYEEKQLSSPVPPWQAPAVGSSRGTVIRSEFVLTDHLSIVVESSVEGNLSGDIKYRFRY
jgi:autotransporter translocation and assembly factor TamB